MVKKEFPQIHYYNQDFVGIYERSWAWMPEFWHKAIPSIGLKNPFYIHKGDETLNLLDSCLASHLLVYLNRKYPVNLMLDNFYSLQEESGAIRGNYSIKTGQPIFTESNPESLSPPLLAWVEFNLYHKVGAKIRVRNVMPMLMAYHDWLASNFKDENGLYVVPPEVSILPAVHSERIKYPLEFNTQMAINAMYLAALADILNDKELGFRYKQQYFSLKTRINSQMWDPADKIYYDLDANRKRIKVKTINAFWSLLAEFPNEEKADGLFAHLKDPQSFGTDNPFPILAVSEKNFDENGEGASGSVVPALTYMVIKGLEKYQKYEFAREVAISHMHFIIDTFYPPNNQKGTLWKAYKPFSDGPAEWEQNKEWNKPLSMAYVGLSTIAMIIENIVGLYVSLPRKTVEWYVPTLELMGIEDLPLKRNRITIISNKSSRGWEINLESEKLYYFSIHLLNEGKSKTLPIPSGKCSMLISKL